MTPIDCLIQIRMRHAAEMLLSGERKVIDVANDCGFSSLSHFIPCFRRITGVAPHVYRNQQREELASKNACSRPCPGSTPTS